MIGKKLLKPDVIVFDIGAHNGQSIEKLYNIYCTDNENIIIYSFEPIPENYQILVQKAKELMNKYNKLTVHTFQFAFDKDSRLAPFYCYGMHTLETNQYSSLRPFKEKDEWLKLVPNQPIANLELTKKILVSCHQGDNFVDVMNIDKIDYLKIDTQGNDLNVLKGFSNFLIKQNVELIEVECQDIELYEGGSKFDEIIQYLGKIGYSKRKIDYQADGHEYVVYFEPINKQLKQGTLSKEIKKIDIVLPFGFHSWNVSNGWINTVEHAGKLGSVFNVNEQNYQELLKYMVNPKSDVILLLGFDHHLKFLHDSIEKRKLWKRADIIKVLMAQETVIQDCYPHNEELSKSAIQCVDYVIFNSANDKPFYDKFNVPSFWQPFGVDKSIFKNNSNFSTRKNKPYFRGKTKPIGLPHTYSKRREILQLLLSNNLVDYKEFEYKNSIDDIVNEFNEYKIAINLPAVFEGFTTRTFESMACGCLLITPRPTNKKEEELFEDYVHLIYYDTNSKTDIIDKIKWALENEDQASKIAENGYKEVLQMHTLDFRLEDILSKIRKNKPFLKAESPKTSKVGMEPSIKDYANIKSKVESTKGFKNILTNHTYSTTIACGQKTNLPLQLPVYFFTIVLNGMPFIKYHINAFKDLPFEWHWHIIEGIADLKNDTAWSLSNGGHISDELHNEGLSNDGTTEYLDNLKKRFPGNITIYRKKDGEFWNGKVEMVNAPLTNINQECILWEIDSDELWTAEQLIQGRQLYINNPHKTASFYLCSFFVGEKLLISSINTYGNHTDYEWLRTWRYQPGDKWISHEPPKLCRLNDSGDWIDLGKIDPFTHAITKYHNLVFQHYAYVLPEQLMFKEKYYGYNNALSHWERLQKQTDFPLKLRNYFPWVNDEAVVDKVDKFNIPLLATFNKNKCVFNFKEIKRMSYKNILFVRIDSIGDNILASCLLEPLHLKYPEAKITIICQNHITELYKNSPFVDKIIGIDKKQLTENATYQNDFFKRLKGVKYDIVLHSTYSREPLGDLLCANIIGPIKVGFAGDLNNISKEQKKITDEIYTHLIPLQESYKSELEKHKDFLEFLGIEGNSLKPRVWLTENDRNFVDNLLKGKNISAKKYIVLFAGAQYEMRLYEHFGKALRSYLSENKYSIIALGSEEDFEINQKNLDDVDVPTLNLSGKTTIRQAAAIIENAYFTIGTETGLAHIACAVNTPNIVLLGGGHFGRFMPYSNLTSIVSLPLDCYMCDWKCKFNYAHCVKDVDPLTIEQAIKQFFESGISENPRLFVQEYFNSDKDPMKPNLDLTKAQLPFKYDEFVEIEMNPSMEKIEFLIVNSKYSEAIKQLEIILEREPHNLDALNNLSVVNIMLGNLEMAEKHIEKVISIDANNEIANSNLRYIKEQKEKLAINYE